MNPDYFSYTLIVLGLLALTAHWLLYGEDDDL